MPHESIGNGQRPFIFGLRKNRCLLVLIQCIVTAEHFALMLHICAIFFISVMLCAHRRISIRIDSNSYRGKCKRFELPLKLFIEFD
jgi:hypothetical protein